MAKTVIRGYSEAAVSVNVSNSTWIVAKHAVLRAPNVAFSDQPAYHDNTFRIDGAVISNAGWDPFRMFGIKNSVIVSEAGLIAGAGINLSGAYSSVENHGTIAAYNNYDAMTLSGVGSSLENFAQVTGRVFVRHEVINHKGATIEDEGGAVVNISSQAGEQGKLTNDGAIICINPGTPSVNAGAGNDRIINNGRLEGRVELGGGNDHFGGSGGTLHGSIYGGAGNDNVTLTRANLPGNSNFVADIFGDAGNDTFRLTKTQIADNISIRGGADHDTYIIDSAKYTIVEDLNEGFDKVKSSVNYELPDNVEQLILTGKTNITALGNEGANNLFGNSANNLLIGKGGNDVFDGKAGNDTLRGMEGSSDQFRFKTGYDQDVITQFDTVDILDLSGWKAIRDFNDFKDHAHKQGNDVVISAGGDSLTIQHVEKSQFLETDFIF